MSARNLEMPETDPDYHDVETSHEAACFREYPDDHDYWNNEPL